jgi:DNA invertase Pin-like site-specific DNA recombinase
MATGNGNYPLTEAKKAKMVEMYMANIPVTEIAKELSIHASTVHRNLNKLGVKEVDVTKRKASAHRLTDEQKAKIVEMYKAGAKIDDITEAVGCSRPTMYLHIENAGLKGFRDVSEEEVDKAIQKYLNYELTVIEILRDTGLSKATFYRRLKKYIEEQEA